MPTARKNSLEVVRDLQYLKEKIVSELGKVIVGQEQIIHLLLSSVLSGGHSLLIGVPGLAKTLLVSTLASVMNVSYNRIQFTPDLMPSDITGSDIIEEKGKNKVFRFIPGPVFSNIVLADEINRTPPKTQAALLQAMQEKQVTFSGTTYPIKEPFFVLATQNPIEQEGTYPLPEAQLDRFMYSIKVPYPNLEEEVRIVALTDDDKALHKLKKVTNRAALLRTQTFIKNEFPIADTVMTAAVRLVRATRPEYSDDEMVKQYVSWGAGPRAGAHLVLAAKSSAALNGKKSVDLEDIRTVAFPVLRHRIVTNYEADTDSITADSIINHLLDDLKI